MNEQKKYTTEDNIKSMMFSLKTLVKKSEEISNLLISILQSISKNDDKNDLPF